MKPSELKAKYLADNLKPGELYAGLILGKDGQPDYHLIKLPGEPTNDLNWKAAKDWAKRIGGELPTRREQSLLYANLKEHFQSHWYWSSEPYEDGKKYAWSQRFLNGFQYGNVVNHELRACAVRRLILE
jgi:hypothetical protein